MIVAPYREFPFLVPRTCSDFFALVQRAAASVHARMVSVSLPLSTVDPFVALDHFVHPEDIHFYWENQTVGEAIAAVGCIAQHDLCGGDRFVAAQRVIEEWFAATAIVGDVDGSLAGPHVFCRFTFFDHHQTDEPFPAAGMFLPQWHISRQHQHTVFVANINVANINTAGAISPQDQCTTLWRHYQQLNRRREPGRRWSPHRSSGPSPSNGSAPDPSHSASGARFQPIPFRPGSSPIHGYGMPPESTVVEGDDRFSSVAASHLSREQKQALSHSVQAALRAIETGTITKAVLAQVLDVTAGAPFKVFPSLSRLRQRHADCHVFSTANGQGHVFLGASPERLLRIRNHTLYTEAIAGSSPRGASSAMDAQLGRSLTCSLKELHEHQLVVNFITQQLTQLGLVPQRSPFPKLLKLTNIQHLHTPIQANLPSEISPLEILDRLHPTPAVAGVPQLPACDLIQDQEAFQRSLYAAPIGWINHRGDSEFVVGIRSALLRGHTARLYAGAGIVRGSQPEQEVSEIELKLQTLLTALVF